MFACHGNDKATLLVTGTPSQRNYETFCKSVQNKGFITNHRKRQEEPILSNI